MPPSHTDEGLRAAVRGPPAGAAARPILVLSQYVEVSYADDLLADRRRRRRSATCSRTGWPTIDEFLDALRRVAAGGTVLDPRGGRPAASSGAAATTRCAS